MLGTRTAAALMIGIVAGGLAAQGDGKGTSDESFALGVGLLKRELYAEAEKAFVSCVEARPRGAEAAEAWYRIGTCRAELARPTEAVVAFETALKRGGKDFAFRAECRYRCGVALRKADRPAEAGAMFEALLREEGESAALYVPAAYAAGEAWRDAGRPADARRAFTVVIEKDRSEDGAYFVPAAYAAGFLAVEAGAFEDAVRLFASAADKHPKHAAAAECRYLAADSSLRLGRAAEALPGLEAAAASGAPYAKDAAAALARAYAALGRTEDAARAYGAVAARNDASPAAFAARLELARLARRAGKHAEAADAAALLLKTPGFPEAFAAEAEEILGFSALDAGRAEVAASALSSALKRKSLDRARAPRLQLALADALVDLARFDDALASYREAARSDDPALRGDARYGEALALHRLGRLEDAFKTLRTFAREHGGHRLSVDATFAEAEVAFGLGRYDDAAARYEAVPAEHALSSKAALKRAWCEYLGGDAAAAAKRFDALVAKKAPSAPDPAAEEALAMKAVAALKAGDDDAALSAADLYRVRHAGGIHLDKTERVAARVLKRRGDLRGASERLAAANKAGGVASAAPADRLVEAELLFRQGDFGGAAKLYEELLSGGADVASKALEGLAWCAFELGDDELCLRRVAAGLRDRGAGDVAPSLRELAVAVYQRSDRHAEAARSAGAFLKAHPGHGRAPHMTYVLGVALARQGRFEEARDVLRTLGDGAGLDRQDLFLYELGWAEKKAGDIDAAVGRFAAAAVFTKDADLGGECRLHVGERYVEQKRFAEARETLLATTGKHRSRAIYRVGCSWLDEGDLVKAASTFESLASDEDVALRDEARFLAGSCRAKLPAWAEAAASLRALLKDAPDHPRAQEARGLLGEAELELGRPNEAAAALEEFLRRAGGDAPRADVARARLNLGRARAGLGDHEAAEVSFAKAADLSDGPIGAEAQFRAGAARRARGDAAGAAEAWLKLAILHAHEPWVSDALFEAGCAFEATGAKDKAKKLFEEATTRFPTSKAAKKSRAKLGAGGG